MVLAVFFATQIAGILMSTAGVDAYLLDAYPEGSGDVGAWINLSRAFGGCMATYIQIEWVQADGPEVVFGIQAGITAGSMVIIVVLHLLGARMRRWQGPMKLATL